VEDALRAVDQAFARVGSSDVRKDLHGNIDFRIQHKIRGYKLEDSPPKLGTPIPISVILFILAQAYGVSQNDDTQAIADMIAIAFFFLLRPGKYTGTTSNARPSRLQDVHSYIGTRYLHTVLCTDADINAARSFLYIFITKKNGIRNEKIVHGISGTGLCLPVHATACRLKCLRLKGAKCNVPIESIYVRNRRTVIKVKQITDTILQAMIVNFHRTGISPDEVSARSLRAGGAIELLCGKVDKNLIKMMCHWNSDTFMHYLHMQAHPISHYFTAKMYNTSTYLFLPDETLVILRFR
jgi:hypothetical protein